MMTEAQFPPVVATPTQGEDTHARWGWVEPSVWTDRMLAALDNGVKGGKWFSLNRWTKAFFQAHGLFSLAATLRPAS